MSQAIENTLIRASAGSGKTQKLAERFIALLDLGVAPDKILALTFSRKAAAEFLERILHLLAADRNRPERLRRVIDHLHRLQLSTIDSFFSLILRSFPFEFGIDGEIAVIDENRAGMLLESNLAATLEGIRGEELGTFEATLEQASRALKQPSLLKTLHALLEDAQEVFLEHPEAEKWGRPEKIWPHPPEWIRRDPFDTAAARLAEWIRVNEPSRIEYFEIAVPELEILARGGTAKSVGGTLLKNLRKFVSGETDHLILDRKRIPSDPDLETRARELLEGVLGRRLQLCLADTAAIHRILERYDAQYQESVRRNGFLSFADLNRALLGRYLPPDSPHPLDQTLLAWRLDGWFDHWMFDEFQDTSQSQWRAVAPLIDEVIQDSDGRRTTFLVGDVKQAIYGWRGGDPHLFDAIPGAYPGRFAEESLDQSWRSGPDLLRCINTIFGSLPQAGIYPSPTVARWLGNWQPHASRRPERQSWAGILRLKSAESEHDALVENVREIRKAFPGSSIGVLYRRNADVVAATEVLREHRIAVTREATAMISLDNSAGKLLLSALRLLDRPGDRTAGGHLAATGRFDDRWKSIHGFCAEGLDLVAEKGFATWASQLLDEFFPGSTDPFIEQRIDNLILSLAEFDAAGEASPSAAIRHLESAGISDPPGENTVQVMTYHKAKGLSFDATIVPLFGKQRHGAYDSSRLHVETEPRTGAGKWVLRMPNSEILAADPVLRSAHESLEADSAHEELCGLYVALTRAKQVLSILLPPKGTHRSARLIEHVFKPTTANPDPVPFTANGEWIASFGCWPPLPDFKPPKRASPQPILPRGRESRARGRLDPEAPSTSGNWESPAALLVSRGNRSLDPLEHGKRVHAGFAQIDWLPPDPGDGPPIDPEVSRYLEATAIRSIFAEPEQPVVLWREQAFDVLAKGRWLSGIFDRVHLFQDTRGIPEKAVIYDFKTDAGDPAATVKHYSGQMHAYREALSALTQLPPEKIETRLVLLCTGRVMEVSGCP